MIRDRLRSAARKAAIRVLGMEFEAEDDARKAEGARRRPASGSIDASKIPKVVDGSGDTPGPNHKEDIGRPYASAQLGGGSACFVDVRRPEEYAAGFVPGALLLPGDLLKGQLHRLPADKVQRVTIYDQTGGEGSAELAAWLRENGWGWARRLRGGFAEWLEHGEAVARPSPPAGGRHRVGEKVVHAEAGPVWVIGAEPGPAYLLWAEGGRVLGPVREDSLHS